MIAARTRLASVGAVGAVLLLAAGAYFLRRPKPDPPPSSSRARPDGEFPSPPLRAKSGADRHDPAARPTPSRESEAARELELRRGRQARRSWGNWKKFYRRKLDETAAQLTAQLALMPAPAATLRTILAAEEEEWLIYIDRLLEPAFREGRRPDWEFLRGPEYLAKVREITARSDAQIEALLDRNHLEPFRRWRKTYIRSRYWWTPGERDD